MKILVLGPYYDLLKEALDGYDDTVVCLQEQITLEIVAEYHYIISFGYRYIISSDILKHFDQKAINLHISYLPWNRGADPNLWSFLENTTKGVSVHYMDKGIDTGDIIAQREVIWAPEDTLRTSYDRLCTNLIDLFMQEWPKIRAGQVRSISQQGMGTFHKLNDRKSYENLMVNGWDTPVELLAGKALVSTNSGVK